MTTVLLVALTLLAQRALGVPGVPAPLALVVLPAVWVVGPALTRHGGFGFWPALVLGLAWDAVMGGVVGPGAIAWSAASLVVAAAATVVADRSPRAWAGFGALAAVVVLVGHHLLLLPLGAASNLGWRPLAVGVALTTLWCGAVGWVRALDLPARWRHYQSRRLR